MHPVDKPAKAAKAAGPAKAAEPHAPAVRSRFAR